MLSVAVLFAPSIKRTQQLNEALADVAQLGYGVESAYGCGLVVTYCQLCGFDFQSLVLDEIADESQFFNIFGCVYRRVPRSLRLGRKVVNSRSQKRKVDCGSPMMSATSLIL